MSDNDNELVPVDPVSQELDTLHDDPKYWRPELTAQRFRSGGIDISLRSSSHAV